MFYIVKSDKPFPRAAKDLEEAVARNGFGVLHVHDLAATLRARGMDFTDECKIFEVCNPRQAARVLSSDMRLNMALPCRISVYTDGGSTCIGMLRPRELLSGLSGDPGLREVAAEVEEKTIRMIDEAARTS